MVPNSLAGDSSRNKNSTGVSPLTARRIGARPGSLPALTRTHNTDPIPVPTQRAAYQAIQVFDWLIYSSAFLWSFQTQHACRTFNLSINLDHGHLH